MTSPPTPSRISSNGPVRSSSTVTTSSTPSRRTGPFELILDGVGGEVTTAAAHRLARGGTLTVYGVASGGPPTLAFYDFAPHSRMLPFFVYQTGEETFGEDLRMMARLVAAGTLDPQLGLVRDWTETLAAVDALRSREVAGKVVLVRG